MIIWDFDGPIVDSREMDLEYAQKLYHDVTAESHRDLFKGNIYIEEKRLRSKGLSEKEHRDYMANVYQPKKLEIVPIEGIREIISKLSKDFRMVINSSSSKSEIHLYLEKYGLREFFEKIYGNEISRSKEEKFKLILKDHELSPNDCLLVTDTLGDVKEAKVVGIPSIAVLWGYHLKDNFLEVSKEIAIVERPAELIAEIKKHFSIS